MFLAAIHSREMLHLSICMGISLMPLVLFCSFLPMFYTFIKLIPYYFILITAKNESFTPNTFLTFIVESLAEVPPLVPPLPFSTPIDIPPPNTF